MAKFILIIHLLLFTACSTSNETNATEHYTFENIAENLTVPWEIFWGPDDWIWFTERPGKISRVNPDTKELVHLITINDVHHSGEGGLMGMTMHPQFDEFPYIYVTYTYRTSNTYNKIARFEYDGEKLHSPFTLLENIPGSGVHNGSRLWIDPDELLLYVTTGDASLGQNSQNMESLAGKVLRMTLDGEIPEGNIGNTYVWTLGHRNAQGLTVANGIMYSSEHGPASNDEFNIIEAHRNYGWPNVNGFCESPSEIQFCEEHNVKEPLIAWTPTTAVAGIDYYGNGPHNDFKNSILLTTLKSSRLFVLSLDETYRNVIDEKELFQGSFGRLRDVCVSPTGRVFIANSNRDGRGNPAAVDDRIIEIIPTGTSVKENNSDKGILDIYPNPTNSSLNIKIGERVSKIFNSALYDMLGNKIKELDLNISDNLNIFEKDGISFSSGNFYIKVNGLIDNKEQSIIVPVHLIK